MVTLGRLINRISPKAALRQAIRLCDEGRPEAALALLRRAAKAGLADAKYQIGLLYLRGSGVPLSRMEATRWLERAANDGHVEAQTTLAALFVHGLANAGNSGHAELSADRLFAADDPSEPDFNAALHWARQAADAGSAKGQAMLAYILTGGPEAVRDLEAAHGWYERSAAAGCPEGCLGYALSLAPQINDEEGRRKVAMHLRQAAKAELPSAIYLLAVLTE